MIRIGPRNAFAGRQVDRDDIGQPLIADQQPTRRQRHALRIAQHRAPEIARAVEPALQRRRRVEMRQQRVETAVDHHPRADRTGRRERRQFRPPPPTVTVDRAAGGDQPRQQRDALQPTSCSRSFHFT
jgi:hypothetical protein